MLPAIGRNPRPGDENSEDASKRSGRASNCRPRRPDGKAYKWRARQHRGKHDIPKTRKPDPGDLDRRQRRRQRYFAVASEAEKHTVDAKDQRDTRETRRFGARWWGSFG